MFERRHMEAIAATVAGLATSLDLRERSEVARDFANMLQRSNPRFDRARFLSAAGLPGHEFSKGN